MSPRSLTAGARRLATFAMLACACLAAAANPALARKQGCLGCHAATSKLVGPAYQDVAAKYGSQPEAVAQLAQSIRNGGSGKWGEMAMPPQKQLSETDATRLAKWILGGAK